MKTILLWDPRFPDRRPARLKVEDAVASAAVRAGVAAAANPAEAGALSAGGALDPTMLTEVVLQHGPGTATRRVFLPYSVVMVGAAAGVLASNGTPIPGGVTPTPTPSPTLTLSSAAPSIASNAAAGTLVSNISNVPAGATPAVTPNDGRLVIAGDSSAGWKVVVGMSALSAGTVNFSVAATGATGASGVLTVTAAGTGPVPFAYQTETQNYMTAATAAGAPMTTQLAMRLDRAVCRIKAAGSAWAKLAVIQLIGPEARWKINLKTGASELTTGGAPTFVEDQYFTTGAATAFYESPVALTAARQNNHTLLLFAKTAAAASEVDCGARDAAGNGITINVKATSGGAVFQSYSAVGSITTAAADWGASGWHGVTRTGAAAGRTTHHGITISTFANASVALTSEPKLRIGAATGSGATTNRQIAAFAFGDALTEAEELEVCTALDDYMECVTYGAPLIQEVGIGDAVSTADVGILGLGAGALDHAYELARQGLSVVMLGDETDYTIWHMCPAVQFVDAKVAGHIKGVERDRHTVSNAILGRADTSSQSNLSFSPRDLMRPIRRMFDPTKTGNVAGTSTAILPGKAGVKIIMCGGLSSVTKTGAAVTSLKTMDGRTINVSYAVEASYMGDLVRLTPGVNYRTACDPVTIGAVTEQNGGFLASYLQPQTAPGGTQLSVDPYLTPGVSSSGLIAGLVADPGLANNAPDPFGLQPMCLRATISSIATRRAPLAVSGQPPRNYSAANYEKHARTFAAATSASVSIPFNPGVFKADATSAGIMDWNNGDMRFGLDVPNSGLALAAAGGDYSARKAVYAAAYDYAMGYFYWLLFSGDARIPASVVTALQGYYLDPRSHLDTGPDYPLLWPKLYRREPVFMLNNQPGGGFVAYAADLYGVDNNAPRSTNTAATISYPADKHAIRDTVNAGVVKVQGAFYDATTGGNDFVVPVPVEVGVPNAAECSNMVVITAPSVSRFYYGSYRMDPTMGMMGQFLAHVIKVAKANGTSVQAAPYATVRQSALAAGDNAPLLMPQVN